MLPKLSPKQKAALCVALALLLWIPSGISQDTQPVVTGHSTFYNGDTYDPCLASIAGIVRSRVMWFNDQVLVERYPGKGTFVYVTQHGGTDPTQTGTLYSDGVSYNFVDPNGAAWHVDELYVGNGIHAHADTEDPGQYETNTTHGTYRTPYAGAGLTQAKQYVWVVELAAQPIYDQFPGGNPHSYYNFLDIVDTCKFDNSTATYGGIEYNNASTNSPQNGHAAGAPSHTHTIWEADLYLGTAPTIVPAGVSTDGANYDTQWATSGNAGNAANAAGSNPSGTVSSQAAPPGGN